MARRPIFSPATPTRVRKALAVRPCLPMTLPRSAGSTWSSITIPEERCPSETTTASGCSTIALTSTSTIVPTPASASDIRLSPSALADSRPLEQLAHRIGGVRSLPEPEIGPLHVQRNLRGLGLGIVMAQALDEIPVGPKL